MRKLSLVWVYLVVLLALSIGSFGQTIKEESRKDWNQFSLEEKKVYVMDQLTTLLSLRSVSSQAILIAPLDYAKNFPFVGIGIEFDTAESSTNSDGSKVLAARITALWKNSPADSAGIAVGDRIISINGESVGVIKQSDKDQASAEDQRNTHKEYLDKIKQLIGKSDIVSIQIERDGNMLTFETKKAEIGRDVGLFVEQNTSRWEKEFAEHKDRAMKLFAECQSANNPEELDGCHEKIKLFWKDFAATFPMQEVVDFKKSFLRK